MDTQAIADYLFGNDVFREAIVRLLVDKGLITEDEFVKQINDSSDNQKAVWKEQGVDIDAL